MVLQQEGAALLGHPADGRTDHVCVGRLHLLGGQPFSGDLRTPHAFALHRSSLCRAELGGGKDVQDLCRRAPLQQHRGPHQAGLCQLRHLRAGAVHVAGELLFRSESILRDVARGHLHGYDGGHAADVGLATGREDAL